MVALGIDIGGSGITGAPVDLTTGTLAGRRYRLKAPQPADVPGAVAAVAALAARFPEAQRVGVAVPGVVVRGITRTAPHADVSWLDAPVADLVGAATGRSVTVLNDADAAGIAEMAFGAGRNQPGVAIMLTLGAGIGSAVFLDGRLVPNTELGHLRMRGEAAVRRASDRTRGSGGLGWHTWARRVHEYLAYLEHLFSPDLMIIGGEVSRVADRLLPLVDIRTPVVPAALHHDAGIVGAALAAHTAPSAG